MSNTAPSASLVWRTAGGSNSRCGLFGAAVRLSRKPARRLPAEGAVEATVVFDQVGTAFIADMAGGVQAYAQDGGLLWRVKLDGGISAAPVVVAGGAAVMVATHTGCVFALEATTGARQWHREISSRSDPRILSDLLHLAEADLVVFSSWGGRFHTIEARTGRERFSWDAGLSPRSAAASDREENIYCLRAQTGHGVEFVRVDTQGQERVLCRAPEDQRGARRASVAAAPVLDEDRAAAYLIFNQTRGAQLLAWSLKTEAELWRQTLPVAIEATPALLQGGDVVVADMAGNVHSFSPNGAARFHCTTGSDYLLAGGVGCVDGTFWIGDPLGIVHTVDRHGAEVSFFEAPRSIQARLSFDPLGRLYVPCADRLVYVFAG